MILLLSFCRKICPWPFINWSRCLIRLHQSLVPVGWLLEVFTYMENLAKLSMASLHQNPRKLLNQTQFYLIQTIVIPLPSFLRLPSLLLDIFHWGFLSSLRLLHAFGLALIRKNNKITRIIMCILHNIIISIRTFHKVHALFFSWFI